MKIFLTADTFFSRPDALNLGNRLEHFVSIDQMDEALIDNWNEVVSNEDIVYHLGNFCWDPVSAEKILRKLNGKIKFILGRYDKSLTEVIDDFRLTHVIVDKDILVDSRANTVMSHWPLLHWPNEERGYIHFHGNGIGRLPMNFEENYRVNCSIDNWNYYPVEYAAIKDIIKDVSEIKEKK